METVLPLSPLRIDTHRFLCVEITHMVEVTEKLHHSARPEMPNLQVGDNIAKYT
jgi:hypothetical protein